MRNRVKNNKKIVVVEAALIGAMKEADAARYIGYSVASLQQWRHFGKGPKYIKMHNSRTIRYRKKHLDEWLDQQEVIEPTV